MNLSHARRLCCPRHERGSVADPCIRPLHLIRRRSGLALSITPAAGECVFVWTADAYDVLGLAPGTVVTVDAVLDFEGWIGTPGCGGPDCAATFRAMVFGEFFDSRRELDAPARARQVSERSSLATPVRLTVGQRNVVGCFLAIRIAPGGYHEGQWTGRLHFSGVPAGVTIVSCQGYADGVVPVRPTSWGRLKAIYR